MDGLQQQQQRKFSLPTSESLKGFHRGGSDTQIPGTPPSRGRPSESTTIGTPESDEDGLGEFPGIEQVSSDSGIPTHQWPEDTDSDEAIDGSSKTRRASSTRIMSSWRKKFGRKFAHGYWMPSDKRELERNDSMHQLRKHVFDGKIHLAPVSNPRNVLDIGAGTGIWAVEFANANPESNVLGVDLNPVRPDTTAPNCRFEIADVNKDWSYDRQFNYIFVRSLGQPNNMRHFVQSIHDALAPGGWVEIQDWVIRVQSSDHSVDGTALERYNKLLYTGMQNLGRALYFCYDYRALFEECGFDNIIERKYAVPSNDWPPGKQNKRMGALMNENGLEVVGTLGHQIISKGHGWTLQQIEELLVEVRRDWSNPQIHAYVTLMSVFCQKPQERTSSTIASGNTSTKSLKRSSIAADSLSSR